MMEIKINKNDIYKGELILVNYEYSIKDDCLSELEVIDENYKDVKIMKVAAHALKKILKKIDAKANIVPVSGFRSQNEQKIIYENSLIENGEKFTKKYVAEPGHSEHQAGLAVDLALYSENIDYICPNFPYEGICMEFRKHALNYGFIERYKNGKEKITKISKEPWHFRYVGLPHSVIIEKNNISLEEYLNILQDYTDKNPYTHISNKGEKTEIYYKKYRKEDDILRIKDFKKIKISGDNKEGLIISIFH